MLLNRRERGLTPRPSTLNELRSTLVINGNPRSSYGALNRRGIAVCFVLTLATRTGAHEPDAYPTAEPGQRRKQVTITILG